MEQVLNKKDIISIIKKNGQSQEFLLAILLDIQKASGKNYVSQEWAYIVAEELKISLSTVYDVLTFYSMFSTTPRGKYIIELCKSATCHITGAKSIKGIFEEMLGINIGETTEDGVFTLQYTSCMGACNIGPAIKINDKVYGHLNKEVIQDILNSYKEGSICQSK